MRRPSRAAVAVALAVGAVLAGSQQTTTAAAPAPALATGHGVLSPADRAPAANALPAARRPALGARLPTCTVDDVRTRFDRLRDWEQTMLDHERRLPSSYAPRDLVPVSRAGVAGVGSVRAVVVKDLRAMARAARKADAAFAVRSAYRSHASQRATFARWTRTLGYEGALRASARAGHSEHQLGTTVDLRAAGSTSSRFAGFGSTKAGRWTAKHAWRYGFVMSYPEGKTAKTCYKFEPWHFRYVGRELARDVHESGLTLREYLWRNVETVRFYAVADVG